MFLFTTFWAIFWWLFPPFFGSRQNFHNLRELYLTPHLEKFHGQTQYIYLVWIFDKSWVLYERRRIHEEKSGFSDYYYGNKTLPGWPLYKCFLRWPLVVQLALENISENGVFTSQHEKWLILKYRLPKTDRVSSFFNTPWNYDKTKTHTIGKQNHAIPPSLTLFQLRHRAANSVCSLMTTLGFRFITVNFHFDLRVV